jgi:hypothetical protein
MPSLLLRFRFNVENPRATFRFRAFLRTPVVEIERTFIAPVPLIFFSILACILVAGTC